MSKYVKIATQIKNPRTLIDVLKKSGIEPAVDLDEGVTLSSRWEAGRQAHIAISKEDVTKLKNGIAAWAGMGWIRGDDGIYELVIDHYDLSSIKPALDSIHQKYMTQEVKTAAHRAGYRIRELKTSDGTVRLQLIGR